MKNCFSVLVFWFSLNLFSCEQNNPEIACDIKDPVNNLAWLKAKIQAFEKSNMCDNNACYMQVYKVNTGNQQQIVTWVTGPAVDGIPQYYTCTGELIICTNEDPCPNLTNAELIWTSKAD
ncbi:hypothetical protein AAE02nite_07360 [Adhaeribacter aerolatus]|uniref:Uncharacterized protein n=1 Tax=Adhaeribacter aerolatus TaxID=670289 RepID=A0A512ATN4_9BACT|nr:hypothetical protein [Adhaeribacter aerolatus]GEO03072.1 hypothetical protein AAE02nite_07360 [Adhaeribacter aerolatus]